LFLYVPRIVSDWLFELRVAPAVSRNPCFIFYFILYLLFSWLFLYVPNSVSVWNFELRVAPAISRNPCLYFIWFVCVFPDCFYMS
jgi:uncharacterized membrane protein